MALFTQNYSKKLVPDDGSSDAELVVIGEAPGRHEDRERRPFVGPAGYRLSQWYTRIGLTRRDIYFTNVFPYRPTKNAIDTISQDVLEPWVGKLHERLALLDKPCVIVPTGNVALRALTGKAYFPWEPRTRDKRQIPGILSHRGSLYTYKDLNGREIKVVPTIHPAATFRSPNLEKRCIRDWQKIKRELIKGRVIEKTPRQTFVAHDLDDIEKVTDFVKRNPQHPIAIDIEWGEDGYVLCVGFALSREWSMTVPTTKAWWGDAYAVSVPWNRIREICESPNPKILHHGHSDAYVLAQSSLRIKINNYSWDTLAMHHLLDANDSHDLAYLASVYTDLPYWKDEAKDPESIRKYASNFDALCNYNGLDCLATYELQEVLYDEIVEKEGMKGILRYNAFYQQLIPRLIEMMLHGVRVDGKQRKRRLLELRRDCIEIQDKITNEVGYELYGKKSLSSKKIAKFLYGDLRLPKKVRTRKRATGEKVSTVTADEVAIRRLMNEHPKNQKLQSVATLILEHRRKYQLSGFFNADRIDADGRMRSSYAPYADSGRLRSSSNPLDGGSNAQNIDREARDIYIPDEGKVFIELDLSLAEDRDVKVRTGSARLIEEAQAPPWERDFHKEAAAKVFDVDIAQVTKDQRYLGKRAKHATNYGETGQKLSDTLITDGYIFTADECQKMIDQVIDEEVRQWQVSIRKEILQFRKLTNAFGRELSFRYDRLSDDIYRKGYAFKPQSDVIDHMNQRGFIPFVKFLEDTSWGKVNIHSHDALLASVDLDHAYDSAMWLRRSLEKPVEIQGVRMRFWTELKVGMSWGDTVEWKKFPTRDEFEAVLDGYRLEMRLAQ